MDRENVCNYCDSSANGGCTECNDYDKFYGKHDVESLVADVERLKGGKYISVKDSLPSCENSHIDKFVIVCVKNKNKEDGIFLYDISSFDGERWSKRTHTWEEILYWMPIPKNEVTK